MTAGWFSSALSRIILGFVLLALTLGAFVGVSGWLAARHRSQLATMDSQAQLLANMETATRGVFLSGTLLTKYVATGNNAAVPTIRADLAQAASAIDKGLADERAIGNGDQVGQLSELAQVLSGLSASYEQALQLRQEGDAAGAQAIVGDIDTRLAPFLKSLGRITATERREAADSRQEAQRLAGQLLWVLVLTGVIGSLFGLVGAVAIGRWVLRPLASLRSVALAVTKGDSKARASEKGPSELASLGRSFNEMTVSLVHQGRSLEVLNRSLDQKVIELESEMARREAAEAAVRHLAYYDRLTELPNRTLFQERLTAVVGQAGPDTGRFAVLFVDLDRFKVVNDTAGHPEGDQLLRVIAGDLRNLMREGDVLARVGGDEFIVLLDGLSEPGAEEQVAERIINCLRKPQTLAGHEFNITASVGIALFPEDGGEAETLITHADIAMYHAKNSGRDRYERYTAAMDESILERLSMENDLRHALDRGELAVYYQPLVDTITHDIIGAEALLRWLHPARGLVMPDQFIPLAEETGLIVPMGEWVLHTACAQAKAWADAGHRGFIISVNLAARQFQKLDLLQTIDDVLRETGLDPSQLQLEITESTAIRDIDYTIMVLTQLRDAGVKVAIDDFGTGHSGLTYLNRFPLDVLKVDKSFIKEVTSNPRVAEIATSVIALAHTLGLRVVAEGVETEEQLAFLVPLRCDEVQGWLFGKAVTAADFLQALTAPRRTAAA